MAVVDKGFGQLAETLRAMEPELGSTTGHSRAELVVNAVADAFLSPTSIAALEILIATRSCEPTLTRGICSNCSPRSPGSAGTSPTDSNPIAPTRSAI